MQRSKWIKMQDDDDDEKANLFEEKICLSEYLLQRWPGPLRRWDRVGTTIQFDN
jgi:hypothetical protein